MTRTTHRSSKGTKLYAVRDKKGQFKDIQTYKKAHSKDAKRVKKSDAVTDALKRNRDIPICAECARKHGAVWPKGHYATWSLGGRQCGGCGADNVGTCPMSDWDWPGRDGRRMRERREF